MEVEIISTKSILNLKFKTFLKKYKNLRYF